MSLYCRIIIVPGVSVDYPYPRIYAPTNILRSNDLSYIVIHHTSYPKNYVSTNPRNFDNPRTLTPMNTNDSAIFPTKML